MLRYVQVSILLMTFDDIQSYLEYSLSSCIRTKTVRARTIPSNGKYATFSNNIILIAFYRDDYSELFDPRIARADWQGKGSAAEAVVGTFLFAYLGQNDTIPKDALNAKYASDTTLWNLLDVDFQVW